MNPVMSVRALARGSVLLSAMIVLAGTTAACASGGANAERRVQPSRQRNLITRSELAEVNGTNAYEAIRALRPEFLRNPGRQIVRSGMAGRETIERMPVVYLDERIFSENPASLRSISTASVAEVRYFSPSEAQIQWGRGHLGGAILVITASR
jgi:hypothetical protein